MMKDNLLQRPPAMTTAWDQYLSGFDDPEKRKAALAWVESRPPEIRALIHRFPPGTTIRIDGKDAFVVSYASMKPNPDGEKPGPGMYFSSTNPAEDYQGALASRFFVCGEHLAE
jgi:hypothetical protein